jgi:hypothetical protein
MHFVASELIPKFQALWAVVAPSAYHVWTHVALPTACNWATNRNSTTKKNGKITAEFLQFQQTLDFELKRPNQRNAKEDRSAECMMLPAIDGLNDCVSLTCFGDIEWNGRRRPARSWKPLAFAGWSGPACSGIAAQYLGLMSAPHDISYMVA